MALEKELEAFKKKLPELKDQQGKFALVHGDDFVDVFSSYEDALKRRDTTVSSLTLSWSNKSRLSSRFSSSRASPYLYRLSHSRCHTSRWSWAPEGPS